jgi:hypothetical protein
MLGKYSLNNLLKEYFDNKPMVDAYLKGESIEGYLNTQVSGMALGVFVLLLIAAVGIFIWAVVVTIKFWKKLPIWSKFLAVIGLIFPAVGPIVTLIAVYIGKESKGRR